MQKAAGEAQAPPKSPTKNFRGRRPKEYTFFTHESRNRGRCGLRIPTNLDRRRFLKTSVAGGAGLLIGFYLPAPGEMLAAPAISAPPAALNAWIHIGTDEPTLQLRQSCRIGCKNSRTQGCAAQGFQAIPDHRQAAQTAGHAGQSKWQSRIWH